MVSTSFAFDLGPNICAALAGLHAGVKDPHWNMASMAPIWLHMTLIFCICIATASPVLNATSKHPNIIFLLTDDQDMALGGLTPMKKLQSMVIEKGTLFTNAFVTTPICCPSRSSILTGKYIHNHGAKNNSAAGNCAGEDWVNQNEKSTMATSLKALGYRTMFAGLFPVLYLW